MSRRRSLSLVSPNITICSATHDISLPPINETLVLCMFGNTEGETCLQEAWITHTVIADDHGCAGFNTSLSCLSLHRDTAMLHPGSTAEVPKATGQATPRGNGL